MKTISSVNSTVSSLNAVESAKLISLLRQVGKKFYLKKTSCLHMTSEEFMSDTWSDRTRVEYHGLTIQLESWTWNGSDYSDLTIYYKGVEINPLQRKGLIQYAKVILWSLSKYDFRNLYRCSLFKDEIAEMLGLKDEIRKIEKRSKKVRKELFKSLVKGN